MSTYNRHPDSDLEGSKAALQRAARRALELGIQTGTPVYVLRDGKIVDIAKEARQSSQLGLQEDLDSYA